MLVVLATCNVVCCAQMTPQNVSGVASCETELASCQAVLDEVGSKKADDVVPFAAVTGTPSSASEGAQIVFCSTSPPIRLPCPARHRFAKHSRAALA
jgi:hypothetical protein